MQDPVIVPFVPSLQRISSGTSQIQTQVSQVIRSDTDNKVAIVVLLFCSKVSQNPNWFETAIPLQLLRIWKNPKAESEGLSAKVGVSLCDKKFHFFRVVDIWRVYLGGQTEWVAQPIIHKKFDSDKWLHHLPPWNVEGAENYWHTDRHTQAHTDTHMHTNRHTQAHTETHTNTQTHAHTCMQTHTCSHSHTNTNTHTLLPLSLPHMHTHAHTCSLTHTLSFSLSLSLTDTHSLCLSHRNAANSQFLLKTPDGKAWWLQCWHIQKYVCCIDSGCIRLSGNIVCSLSTNSLVKIHPDVSHSLTSCTEAKVFIAPKGALVWLQEFVCWFSKMICEPGPDLDKRHNGKRSSSFINFLCIWWLCWCGFHLPVPSRTEDYSKLFWVIMLWSTLFGSNEWCLLVCSCSVKPVHHFPQSVPTSYCYIQYATDMSHLASFVQNLLSPWPVQVMWQTRKHHTSLPPSEQRLLCASKHANGHKCMWLAIAISVGEASLSNIQCCKCKSVSQRCKIRAKLSEPLKTHFWEFFWLWMLLWQWQEEPDKNENYSIRRKTKQTRTQETVQSSKTHHILSEYFTVDSTSMCTAEQDVTLNYFGFPHCTSYFLDGKKCILPQCIYWIPIGSYCSSNPHHLFYDKQYSISCSWMYIPAHFFTPLQADADFGCTGWQGCMHLAWKTLHIIGFVSYVCLWEHSAHSFCWNQTLVWKTHFCFVQFFGKACCQRIQHCLCLLPSLSNDNIFSLHSLFCLSMFRNSNKIRVLLSNNIISQQLWNREIYNSTPWSFKTFISCKFKIWEKLWFLLGCFYACSDDLALQCNSFQAVLLLLDVFGGWMFFSHTWKVSWVTATVHSKVTA